MHIDEAVKQYQLMVDRISSLDDDNTPDDSGICNVVATRVHWSQVQLQDIFELWPEFSGDVQFPVPSFIVNKSAVYEYLVTSGQDYWNRSTEYGAARWRLVEHTKFHLEQRLATLKEMQLVVQALTEIKEHRITKWGICDNVTTWFIKSGADDPPAVWYDTAMEAMTLWPEYSGDINYPVKSPNRWSSLLAAFHAYHEFNRWEGDYGAARFRLLDYLIEYYSKSPWG